MLNFNINSASQCKSKDSSLTYQRPTKSKNQFSETKLVKTRYKYFFLSKAISIFNSMNISLFKSIIRRKLP